MAAMTPPSRSTAGIVHVTFVDHETRATLGEVSLHASRLPASFTDPTVLHLGDDDWEVVAAEPPASIDYLRTGALTLTLRHVPGALGPDQSLAPKTALFAHPTLADPLPGSGAARPDDATRVLELREDTWRQIELVTESAFEAVTAEFAAIERVVAEAQVPGGFARVHARRTVPAPLAGVDLSLEGLRASFKRVVRDYAAVAFVGQPGAIDGAYAFRTASELTVYGTARDGRVETIALRPDRTRKSPPLDAAALAVLRRAHGLVLVDWCARAAVRPGTKPRDVS